MKECVACGDRYSGDNHHCDPRKERLINAGRKGRGSYLEESGREKVFTEADRLNNGFYWMFRDENL